MLYSAQTNGFYVKEIHGGSIPEDAKEISDEVYAQVVVNRPGNMEVYAGANGLPAIRPRSEVLPPSISMYQLRMALIDEGKSDTIENAILAMPAGKVKQKALAAWQTAGVVERNSEFAHTVASILDWSEPQMNELFKRAVKV